MGFPRFQLVAMNHGRLVQCVGASPRHLFRQQTDEEADSQGQSLLEGKHSVALEI